MSLDLSRGVIIAEGLSQAGRPDLTSEARLWLNLFLDKVYQNQDWPWLTKTADSLAVTQGGSIPTDYRAALSASLGLAGSQTEIELIGADRYDFEKRQYGNSSGKPLLAYIDHDLRQVYFLPTPEAGLVWNLKYYYLPILPDHTDSGTDSDIPKWGAPYQILIDEIKHKAMEYNDDTRQKDSKADVMTGIAEHKVNSHDKRAGKHRLKLGKSFRNKRY